MDVPTPTENVSPEPEITLKSYPNLPSGIEIVVTPTGKLISLRVTKSFTFKSALGAVNVKIPVMLSYAAVVIPIDLSTINPPETYVCGRVDVPTLTMNDLSGLTLLTKNSFPYLPDGNN